jgi:hypothetical protein
VVEHSLLNEGTAICYIIIRDNFNTKVSVVFTYSPTIGQVVLKRVVAGGVFFRERTQFPDRQFTLMHGFNLWLRASEVDRTDRIGSCNRTALVGWRFSAVLVEILRYERKRCDGN